MTSGSARLAKTPKVAIIGAGVIGLGIAWRLAAKGATVDVFDRARGGKRRQPCGGRDAGRLLRSRTRRGRAGCAWTRQPGALAGVRRRVAARRPASTSNCGRRARWSSRSPPTIRRASITILRTRRSSACRSNGFPPPRRGGASRTSPASSRARCGARKTIRSTTASSRPDCASRRKRAGATIHEHTPVKEISIAGGRADGVVLADGVKVAADVVVLAAGAWSRGIAGVAPEHRPPVRPIKGQMLALKMDPAAPLINHVIWAPGVYMVPRRDGRLIVGATVEEKAFDTLADRRRPADACWRRLAHGAVRSRNCHRRDVGRSPAGQPR